MEEATKGFMKKMPLLVAEKKDSQGHVFTKGCLQKIVDTYKAGQFVPVITGFNPRGDDLGLICDMELTPDGLELLATIELFTTKRGEAAAKLVQEGQLELAAAAFFNQEDVECVGDTVTIRAINLTETALVTNKVK